MRWARSLQTCVGVASAFACAECMTLSYNSICMIRPEPKHSIRAKVAPRSIQLRGIHIIETTFNSAAWPIQFELHYFNCVVRSEPHSFDCVIQPGCVWVSSSPSGFFFALLYCGVLYLFARLARGLGGSHWPTCRRRRRHRERAWNAAS